MNHAKLICVTATLLLSSLATPARAQSSDGAPIFRLPNFIGDARVDDLYIYMHEPEREQWDTYRNRLHAAAGAIENQQPLQESPTPATIGSGASAFMSMANSMATGAANASQQQTMASGSGSQQQGGGTGAGGSTAGSSTLPGQQQQATMYVPPQPQVSTSVTGAVMLPPEAVMSSGFEAPMAVPGLIGP